MTKPNFIIQGRRKGGQGARPPPRNFQKYTQMSKNVKFLKNFPASGGLRPANPLLFVK